jgi:hypothetical protein
MRSSTDRACADRPRVGAVRRTPLGHRSRSIVPGRVGDIRWTTSPVVHYGPGERILVNWFEQVD